MQLRVAEQYILRFGELAKATNTVILPANVADVGSMIQLAMSMIAKRSPARESVPPTFPESPAAEAFRSGQPVARDATRRTSFSRRWRGSSSIEQREQALPGDRRMRTDLACRPCFTLSAGCVLEFVPARRRLKSGRAGTGTGTVGNLLQDQTAILT